MKSSALRWAAAALGVFCASFALLVDRLGLGKPGFGELQTVLLLVGLGLALVSVAARRRRQIHPSERPPEATPYHWVKSFRRRYVAAAIVLLNVLVLFLGLNVVLLIGFRVTDALGWTAAESAPGVSGALAFLRVVRLAATWASPEESNPLDLADADLASIYPGWIRSDVAQLIRETRTRKLGYLPFAQFGELAYSGRFVSVSEHGYRNSGNQAPWPSAPGSLNIWVLGGSTTFGYGLRDEETIPSFLQAFLAERIHDRPVAVYNFGQAFYYSSQELALFYRLLSQPDVRPDVVVFVDGINEHLAEPFFSQALRSFMESPYRAPYLRPQAASVASSEKIVRRYVKNRELIEAWCEAGGILPLFVWQPSPIWKYDQRFHFFPVKQNGQTRAALPATSDFYSAMERYAESAKPGWACGFLSLADLQVGVEEPLYVDKIHYTALFSRTIAGRIGASVIDLLRGPCSEQRP